jgi:hypothetical protein
MGLSSQHTDPTTKHFWTLIHNRSGSDCFYHTNKSKAKIDFQLKNLNDLMFSSNIFQNWTNFNYINKFSKNKLKKIFLD